MTKKWNPRPEVISYLEGLWNSDNEKLFLLTSNKKYDSKRIVRGTKSGRTEIGRAVYNIAAALYDFESSDAGKKVKDLLTKLNIR